MRFYIESVIENGQRHPSGYLLKSAGGRYLGVLGLIYDAVLAQRIVELLNADVRRKDERKS